MENIKFTKRERKDLKSIMEEYFKACVEGIALDGSDFQDLERLVLFRKKVILFLRNLNQ